MGDVIEFLITILVYILLLLVEVASFLLLFRIINSL